MGGLRIPHRGHTPSTHPLSITMSSFPLLKEHGTIYIYMITHAHAFPSSI